MGGHHRPFSLHASGDAGRRARACTRAARELTRSSLADAAGARGRCAPAVKHIVASLSHASCQDNIGPTSPPSLVVARRIDLAMLVAGHPQVRVKHLPPQGVVYGPLALKTHAARRALPMPATAFGIHGATPIPRTFRVGARSPKSHLFLPDASDVWPFRSDGCAFWFISQSL